MMIKYFFLFHSKKTIYVINEGAKKIWLLLTTPKQQEQQKWPRRF